MTSQSTATLALTTTFTPPADCGAGGPWAYPQAATVWFKVGGDNVTSYWPSAYPFSKSLMVYSPGICPAGWASACDEVVTRSGATNTIASCCPSSFTCQPRTSSFDGWDSNYGCVSQYSVNTDVWGLNSGQAYVNSMYQLPVMIIEARTTSDSSTSVPPSSIKSVSQPTSSSTGGPSTTDSATSTSSHKGALSSGAVAGIVVGVVAGSAIVGLLAYIAWRLRKKQAADNSALEYSEDPAGKHYLAEQYHTGHPSELDAGHTPEMDASTPRQVPMHELRA